MKRKRQLKHETELNELFPEETNVCLNPWNGVCQKTDITVYMCYEGRTLPICRECWREIASTDLEWRYN
jgi:hypothetical protein